jgi:hypothetical protein
MNKRIFGDEDTIKRAKENNTGTSYINWDAINELPDEFEAIITEIKFDPKKLDADFAPIDKDSDGKVKTWMPQPQLMYRIAEACGISGGDNSLVEPLIEEVDINPMMMKPMDAEPTIRKMIVGRKVTKYSERLQEDGTFLKSSPCTSAYNAYDRCCTAWADEEKWTDGYAKKGKYDNKYDTPFKRKAHFYSELKFAHAKAETKAHEKTIRELAGLQTGYKTEMLSSGSLTFARIRRSREILKLESAARIGALSRGDTPKASALFSDKKAQLELLQNAIKNAEKEIEPDPFATGTETVDVEAKPEPEKPKTQREQLIHILELYQGEGLLPKNMIKEIENVLTWLHKNADAESQANLWLKAINRLKLIEDTIPAKGREEHDLYKATK